METKPTLRDGNQRVFFVYDHRKHREEDDPKDAVLYFYPPSATVEEQIALVGGLVGMINFCMQVLQSLPSLITLTTYKFALLKTGSFILGLSADVRLPERFAILHLHFLWNTFTLYQNSLEAVRQRAGPEKFAMELNHIWNSYLSFSESYGDPLSQAFSAIPYINLPKMHNSLFLQASHILQQAQRKAGVIAGLLLNRSRVLCTQLSVDLTRHLLILMPKQDHFPCTEIKPEFDLPGGVRLLCVFLTQEELDTLGPTKSSAGLAVEKGSKWEGSSQVSNQSKGSPQDLSVSSPDSIRDLTFTADDEGGTGEDRSHDIPPRHRSAVLPENKNLLNSQLVSTEIDLDNSSTSHLFSGVIKKLTDHNKSRHHEEEEESVSRNESSSSLKSDLSKNGLRKEVAQITETEFKDVAIGRDEDSISNLNKKCAPEIEGALDFYRVGEEAAVESEGTESVDIRDNSYLEKGLLQNWMAEDEKVIIASSHTSCLNPLFSSGKGGSCENIPNMETMFSELSVDRYDHSQDTKDLSPNGGAAVLQGHNSVSGKYPDSSDPGFSSSVAYSSGTNVTSENLFYSSQNSKMDSSLCTSNSYATSYVSNAETVVAQVSDVPVRNSEQVVDITEPDVTEDVTSEKKSRKAKVLHQFSDVSKSSDGTVSKQNTESISSPLMSVGQFNASSSELTNVELTDHLLISPMNSLDMTLDLLREGASSVLTLSDDLMSPYQERIVFDQILQRSDSQDVGMDSQRTGKIIAVNSGGDTFRTDSAVSRRIPTSLTSKLALAKNKTHKKEESADISTRVPVMLYLQGHMDTLLVLVMQHMEKITKDSVNALWKLSLTKLAELDFAVNDADSANVEYNGSGATYLHLRYDTFTQALSGSGVKPVTSLANELMQSSILLHDSFCHKSDVQTITCRSHTSCCYGHKTVSNETYLQVSSSSKENGGYPDPSDISFSLDEISQRKLYSDFNVSVL